MSDMAEVKLQCRLCGLSHSQEQGRLQGQEFFVCTQCATMDRSLRRHLGDREGLPDWSVSDQQAFFRQMKQTKESSAKNMPWKTVRAALVTSLTTSVINTFSATVETEELPLSVWLQRGWDEELVKKQKQVFSEEYDSWVYCVPVRKLTWARTFQQVEQQVLTKEKELQKKKGGKRDVCDDLDVPVAQGTDKNDAKTAKQEVAKEKKVKADNERVHAAAAKALGPLSCAESNLQKLLAKVAAQKVTLEEGTQKCVPEVLGKLGDWCAAARAVVNQHQANRAKGEETKEEALPKLPWDAESLKALLKQCTEVGKAVKLAIPVKKPKAKAAPVSQKTEQTEGEGAQAPKRRRTGKQA